MTWLKCLLAVCTAAAIAAGASTVSVSTAEDVPVAEDHETYVISEGAVTFSFDPEALEASGFTVIAHGESDGPVWEHRATFNVQASSTLQIQTVNGTFHGIAGGEARTLGAFLLGTPQGRDVIGNMAIGVDSDGVVTVATTLEDPDYPEVTFELLGPTINFDAESAHLELVGELAIARSWAWSLGASYVSGTVIGTMVLDADMRVSDTDVEELGSSWSERSYDAGRSEPAVIGPDVIIGDLQGIWRHCELNGITAYSVATNACNIGDDHAGWISYNNHHPLIFAGMFRMKDDRFEQIGMSWVKHGFYAISQNLCGDPPACFCDSCDPEDPSDECLVFCRGAYLAVGCSDPYSASLNGEQGNMSPRSQVNGDTAYFPFPPTTPWPDDSYGSCIERRLQVHNYDLDPLQNEGATYFVQGHYILPDDALAGNSNNNASYRKVNVILNQGKYGVDVDVGSPTQREQPAVRAWQDYDPSVVETDIQVPSEGLFILGAKATELGTTGYWRYSYALENLNSDRSAGSFTVPIFPGVEVENVGFHDVDYHSGESYQWYQTDWSWTIESHSITWFTDSYDTNPDANALRFSTLYNFYFDANVPPAQGRTVTIGLFKPGQPTEVTGESVGPSSSVSDCNGNEITDDCDIDCGEAGGPCDVEGCGESTDCDSNSIPDECQLDCNGNDVADTCDILFGTSDDCNVDLIPDECQTDCNGNGVPDDCDVDPTDPDGNEDVSPDCQPNGVPDECDMDCDGDGIPSDCDLDEDADDDGIDDCLDECPYTTPAEACVCDPDEIGLCCMPSGLCFQMTYSQCVLSGGTPECQPETVCRDGCLYGDHDRDGDIDLKDMAAFQNGFSGPVEDPGFVSPPMDCRFPFDTDDDGDIDLTDYAKLNWDHAGP